MMDTNLDITRDLDALRIQECLQTKWLGKEIVLKEETDSTNVQAKILAEQNVENGTVVITQRQTAGRGRRGREWISPSGNVYMTMLLRPNIHPEHAASITLVAALAMTKAINQMTDLKAMIKWPNDIVVNGKKCCGILTESNIRQGQIDFVVVGIGINVNQDTFEQSIRDMATSLYLETDKKIDRSHLIAVFFECFERYYEIFLQTQDLRLLREEYNKQLVNRGKEVKIIEQGNECIRTACGIDNQGGLIVEDQAGNIQTIISGEVSVRGLYGYI